MDLDSWQQPRRATLLCGLALGALLIGSATAEGAQEEVNVYSYRQPFLIQPMFDAFTRETGIEVNTVFAEQGLVERLRQEGENSPADLIFTVDIGRLAEAEEAGVTQAVSDPVLDERIPAHFRDPEGHWFGLTTRARLIYTSKDRVEKGAITSYEDLADPRWKGKVCTRSGTHVYQVALLASMIAHHGRDAAKTWLEGVKANLARKPQGNDRAQVKAIMEGVCDVALGNSYYMGYMLSNEEQYPWAQSASLVFPNQDGRGTHVNISGMALTKGAPNRENALKLMRFLADDLAQQMYAEQNHEYPIKDGVPWSGLLQSWGIFEADELALAEIAENRAEAVRIVNEVGYNE